jgi:hypothetical protein
MGVREARPARDLKEADKSSIEAAFETLRNKAPVKSIIAKWQAKCI